MNLSVCLNLNINVLISTHDKRPPLLKGHISAAKGVASQEGFYCTYYPFINHNIMYSTSTGTSKLKVLLHREGY